MSQANERNAGKDLTSIVNIAANECHQGETAVNDSVLLPVNKPVTDKDKWHSLNPVLVALPIGKRNTAVTCAYCGVSFLPKRSWGRFCNGRCRIAAFRTRQVVME